MNDVALARVLNGAAWLDENYLGWWKTIDVVKLDIARGDKCILTQVFEALPADRQEKMRAEVIRRGYLLPTSSGRANGYSVIVFFHDLPQAGLPYGFWQGFTFGPNSTRADDLNEMWIKTILSYRLINATLDELTAPVAVPA